MDERTFATHWTMESRSVVVQNIFYEQVMMIFRRLARVGGIHLLPTNRMWAWAFCVMVLIGADAMTAPMTFIISTDIIISIACILSIRPLLLEAARRRPT